MWIPRPPEVFGKPCSPALPAACGCVRDLDRVAVVGPWLGVEIEPQLIGMVHVRLAHRPRVQGDRAHLRRPADHRDLGRADLVGSRPRERDPRSLQVLGAPSEPASGRRHRRRGSRVESTIPGWTPFGQRSSVVGRFRRARMIPSATASSTRRSELAHLGGVLGRRKITRRGWRRVAGDRRRRGCLAGHDGKAYVPAAATALAVRVGRLYVRAPCGRSSQSRRAGRGAFVRPGQLRRPGVASAIADAGITPTTADPGVQGGSVICAPGWPGCR